jgi:hypothetical protein
MTAIRWRSLIVWLINRCCQIIQACPLGGVVRETDAAVAE